MNTINNIRYNTTSSCGNKDNNIKQTLIPVINKQTLSLQFISPSSYDHKTHQFLFLRSLFIILICLLAQVIFPCIWTPNNCTNNITLVSGFQPSSITTTVSIALTDGVTNNVYASCINEDLTIAPGYSFSPGYYDYTLQATATCSGSTFCGSDVNRITTSVYATSLGTYGWSAASFSGACEGHSLATIGTGTGCTFMNAYYCFAPADGPSNNVVLRYYTTQEYNLITSFDVCKLSQSNNANGVFYTGRVYIPNTFSRLQFVSYGQTKGSADVCTSSTTFSISFNPQLVNYNGTIPVSLNTTSILQANVINFPQIQNVLVQNKINANITNDVLNTYITNSGVSGAIPIYGAVAGVAMPVSVVSAPPTIISGTVPISVAGTIPVTLSNTNLSVLVNTINEVYGNITSPILVKLAGLALPKDKYFTVDSDPIIGLPNYYISEAYYYDEIKGTDHGATYNQRFHKLLHNKKKGITRNYRAEMEEAKKINSQQHSLNGNPPKQIPSIPAPNFSQPIILDDYHNIELDEKQQPVIPNSTDNGAYDVVVDDKFNAKSYNPVPGKYTIHTPYESSTKYRQTQDNRRMYEFVKASIKVPCFNSYQILELLFDENVTATQYDNLFSNNNKDHSLIVKDSVDYVPIKAVALQNRNRWRANGIRSNQDSSKVDKSGNADPKPKNQMPKNIPEAGSIATNPSAKDETKDRMRQLHFVINRLKLKVTTIDRLATWIHINSPDAILLDALLRLDNVKALLAKDDGSYAYWYIVCYKFRKPFKYYVSGAVDRIPLITILQSKYLKEYPELYHAVTNENFDDNGWDDLCAIRHNNECHTLMGNINKTTIIIQLQTNVNTFTKLEYSISEDSSRDFNYLQLSTILDTIASTVTDTSKFIGKSLSIELHCQGSEDIDDFVTLNSSETFTVTSSSDSNWIGLLCLINSIRDKYGVNLFKYNKVVDTCTITFSVKPTLKGGMQSANDQNNINVQPLIDLMPPSPIVVQPKQPEKGNVPDTEQKTDDYSSTIANALIADMVTWDQTITRSTTISIPEIISRWATAVTKNIAMKFNNVGLNVSCSIYEMYFSNFLTNINNGGVPTVTSTFASVSPSDGINIKVEYTKIGAALQSAIKSNDMLMASQVLRINNDIVNGTNYMRALTDTDPLAQASALGSMCVLPLRWFLYLYSWIPLLGPEHAAAISNAHIVLPNGDNITPTMFGNYFPFSPGADNVLPVLPAMLITYQQFTQVRFGTLTLGGNAAPFAMNTWGNSTAVVPIPMNMADRGSVLALWTLGFLEYPFRRVHYATTLVDDANLQRVIWPGFSEPGCTNVRVDGPYDRVLFVICGMSNISAGNNFVANIGNNNLLQLANNVNNVVAGVVLDIAPALDNMMGPQMLPAITQCIYEYSLTLGAQEDINTALFVAADVSHRVAMPIVVKSNNVQYGYYLTSQGGGVPNYIFANSGWVNIGANNPYPQDAINTPLCTIVPLTVLDLQNRARNILKIGTLNPFLPSDIMQGILRPVNMIKGFPMNNISAIANMLRKIARAQNLLMDTMVRQAQLSSHQLYVPDNALNTSTTTNMVWDTIYKQINYKFANSMCTSFQYQGSFSIMLPNVYWNTYTNLQNSNPVACGRVPKLFLNKIANLKWPILENPFTTKLFGDVEIAENYPNQGDNYDVVQSIAPATHDNDAWITLTYFITSAFANISRPINVGLSLRNGTSPQDLSYPATTPSIGRSTSIVLQNYPVVNFASYSICDIPINGSTPIFDTRLNKDVHLILYGNDYGQISRTTVKDYRMLVPMHTDNIQDVRNYGNVAYMSRLKSFGL